MKIIRWGIIGCGNVTEIKSGPGFQKADYSKLVAVMRRDANKAADYARRHQVKKWYSSARDLIYDPEVDAVYIATPPHKHMHYTLLTAAAGKPVYVEKPMARTYEECKKMIHACESAHIPLFTAYYRRSLPRFIKVKEIINQGHLGDIRSVIVVLYQSPRDEDYDHDNLPWRVLPDIAGGGYFVDLAAHTLDILDYFLGPILHATGSAENQAGLYPAEDIVTAHFKFESGIIGTGIWCFTAGTHSDLVEIVGSQATIRFSTFGDQPIELIRTTGHKKWKIDHPAHIQQPHIQSIVNELNQNGYCPSNGKSAARTNQVIDWILADWRKKNNIIFDESPDAY
jgi:predicted dehydrogenase